MKTDNTISTQLLDQFRADSVPEKTEADTIKELRARLNAERKKTAEAIAERDYLAAWIDSNVRASSNTAD